MSPWEKAIAVPSDSGFALDVMAYLMTAGSFVISAPEFFLLARPVPISAPVSELQNPFEHWPDSECDAWCIGLCSGDAVAAYQALITIGGHKNFVCWQSERGIKVRRSGPSLIKFLRSIQCRQLQREQSHSPQR